MLLLSQIFFKKALEMFFVFHKNTIVICKCIYKYFKILSIFLFKKTVYVFGEGEGDNP